MFLLENSVKTKHEQPKKINKSIMANFNKGHNRLPPGLPLCHLLFYDSTFNVTLSLRNIFMCSWCGGSRVKGKAVCVITCAVKEHTCSSHTQRHIHDHKTTSDSRRFYRLLQGCCHIEGSRFTVITTQMKAGAW